MTEIAIYSEFITLSQLLKWAGIAENGAQAKIIIKAGLVAIDGNISLMPGQKVRVGQIIAFEQQKFLVVKAADKE